VDEKEGPPAPPAGLFRCGLCRQSPPRAIRHFRACPRPSCSPTTTTTPGTIYRTLFEIEGYRVIEAENGLAVLAVLRAEHPDLIMLNLLMPHLDGHGVLEAIRGPAAPEDIPCLVFTGDARFRADGKGAAQRRRRVPHQARRAARRAPVVEELLRERGTGTGSRTRTG
jgi:CheY-like chemotaxis protein